ncbi:alpha/beta hydrolase [Oceanobacter sp. 4_MG-2023]|uniref:alpha/beta hydrolase n=1 Tax=Oceanobacter sp. 4_MG-2023 TaxID=3062623 RepID=UPI002733E72D|nr:alpha/beta fold hydrolase [Oceanobacter sp. 4_MG-2023]MDP2548695.1 alpha/beta fold hydrolase [Oceanobacter sp. 4_MG-2023]
MALRRWWRGGFVMAGTIGLLVLMTGCASLTRLYFHPQQVWVRTPAALGLAYDDVELTAADGTLLHAWWLPGQKAHGTDSVIPGLSAETAHTDTEEPLPVVLYLHGNAENISSHLLSVAWLPAQGVGLLALDYRGFGASQGQPLLPDVLQDLHAAAAWLQQRFPERPLVVMGQSIGAGLAVPFVADSAARYGIDALVLEAPPARYAEVARDMFSRSWIGWALMPATWLLPSDWDPDAYAAAISVPVLVIHSPEDQVIRIGQGKILYSDLTGSACWIEASGPHVAAFAQPEVRQQTLEFLSGLSCPALSK